MQRADEVCLSGMFTGSRIAALPGAVLGGTPNTPLLKCAMLCTASQNPGSGLLAAVPLLASQRVQNQLSCNHSVYISLFASAWMTLFVFVCLLFWWLS